MAECVSYTLDSLLQPESEHDYGEEAADEEGFV